ncbi:FkbM family methyltransferase, partial [Patescibacteria group bacterium]|nr:FkbM family methyltransferase [Patescibacteria group bacterium]
MQSSKLQKYTIYHNNSEEYHRLKREIFTQDLYCFETNNPEPIIIDAGAHIGLSVLYFKQLYPTSKIIAIEPNPESFKILERNIFENQIEDVTLIQTALSDKSGIETLYLDKTSEEWHSVASFHKGSWVGTQKSTSVTVQTHTLSEFITQPIDFLKMDIEGVEQKVLTTAV